MAVDFSQEHKQMLQHAKLLVEREKIAVNSKLDKLITSLRTAIEQGEGRS
jgi:hypothetical protein